MDESYGVWPKIWVLKKKHNPTNTNLFMVNLTEKTDLNHVAQILFVLALRLESPLPPPNFSLSIRGRAAKLEVVSHG
jgi:hypothetical protein